MSSNEEPSVRPPQTSFPWSKRGTLRCRSKDTLLCLCFAKDDALLVAGFYDGTLCVFDTTTLTATDTVNVQHVKDGKPHKAPVTSLTLRPRASQPTVLATTTDGYLDWFDLTSLEKPAATVYEENETYTADYSPNGDVFATGGRDAIIRIYSDASRTVLRTIRMGPDHPTNVAALRVFCVRFDPKDPKRLYSAGWDNTIHQHRLNEAPSEDPEGDHRHQFYGAYVTGEAMDLVGDGMIVTVSHRVDDVIQLWDSTTGKPTTLSWPVSFKFLPSCARLSTTGGFLAAGGAGGQGLADGAFVLDLATGKPVVELKSHRLISSCCFGVDTVVAFGDADGAVHMYDNRLHRGKQ